MYRARILQAIYTHTHTHYTRANTSESRGKVQRGGMGEGLKENFRTHNRVRKVHRPYTHILTRVSPPGQSVIYRPLIVHASLRRNIICSMTDGGEAVAAEICSPWSSLNTRPVRPSVETSIKRTYT